MARTEGNLTCCMITQALVPEYWNWDDPSDLQAIKDNDVKRIGEIILRKLEDAGASVAEMYVSPHDKDIKKEWSEIEMKMVQSFKTNHIHDVVKFRERKFTLEKIAEIVGLQPQFVEKAGSGRFGYDNMISYLTHIKYPAKYQYPPSEILTIVGPNYMGVHAERESAWVAGRAKLKTKDTRETIDWLEEEILKGNIAKAQLLLTDDYYDVYARNKRRCDDALETYADRKVYKTIQAMESGLYKLSVLFITGHSGSGKSIFTDNLVKRIKQKSQEKFGDPWLCCDVASSNPLDDFLGEEILTMDDLRGGAMSATDWLKLLDPDRVGKGSARYKNKKMACRCIIINSEKDALDFFYYTKKMGSNRSEAMDQFFRRIMAKVEVYKVPASEERRTHIGLMCPTAQPYPLGAPDGATSGDLMLNYGFYSQFTDGTDLTNMEYNNAIEYLSDLVMSRNSIEETEVEYVN